MAIAPIETKYKGYRFRSRLEARWAVFFDAANITWEYESDGYDVNGKYYLPDFYLPDQNVFFEVKGIKDYDQDLLQGLADITNRRVVLAVGNIPEGEDWDYDENWEGFRAFFPSQEPEDDLAVAWGDNDMFLRCDGCGRVQLMNEIYVLLKDGCCEGSRLMPLGHAFETARSARFEHGEKG